jgi:hypothetical protein
MDSQNLLDLLFKKLDRVDERLDKVDKNLAVYNEQLKLHIEGVVQNRKAIQKLDESMKPLNKHVHMVEGGLKLIGIISLLSGIALAFFRIFNGAI